MTERKRHSTAEIRAKLAQASEWATDGKRQSEIARALGVSVMTLHRWRKALAIRSGAPSLMPDETCLFEQELGRSRQIADLELENSRLRRLVTDLLLEKMKLEEASADRNMLNSSSHHGPLLRPRQKRHG